jgi:hypothetical protein
MTVNSSMLDVPQNPAFTLTCGIVLQTLGVLGEEQGEIFLRNFSTIARKLGPKHDGRHLLVFAKEK